MKAILVINLLIVLFEAIICEKGICSWYGQEAAGGLTASGEVFIPSFMTAAHKTLPFNTRVRVKCVGKKRSVVVRINDRGPFTAGRILDLSEGAAKKLKIIKKGICPCSFKKI